MGEMSGIFNFENIGSKIKNLAKWSCWITILLIWIAAPITFIVLVSDDWTAELCWIPLVGAIVGPIFVWVGSWTMYAFGEFVEDIHAMRNKEGTTNKVISSSQKEAAEKAKPKTPLSSNHEVKENVVVPVQIKNGKYECPKCGCSVKKGQEKCLCFSKLDWNEL